MAWEEGNRAIGFPGFVGHAAEMITAQGQHRLAEARQARGLWRFFGAVQRDTGQEPTTGGFHRVLPQWLLSRTRAFSGVHRDV